MEAGELIADFRRRADDAVTHNDGAHLYEDVDVYRWLNEAEREACIRAKLLFDATKPSVCFYRIAPGLIRYTLSPLIIEVVSARLDRAEQFPGWNARELRLADQSNIKRRMRVRDYGNFPTRRDPASLIGIQPRAVSIDGRTLTLYGVPDASYAPSPNYSWLKIEVYRLPLEYMEGDTDEPEIAPVHHDGLVDWMLFRAFSVKDAELNDPARAAMAEAAFEQRYGPRPSASALRLRQEGRDWHTHGTEYGSE